MRKLYFVRHGKPLFPSDERYCIGQTDLPLSTLGRLQCVQLRQWTKDLFMDIPVFCSPLLRAKDTAAFLHAHPISQPALMEMHAGAWEGLSFRQIQDRWPELYSLRGNDQNIPIPGAEDVEAGLQRFLRGVQACMESCAGDLVIVAHSTVIQALLAHAEGTELHKSRQYRLPLCSVSELSYDGTFHVNYYGRCITPRLEPALCQDFLDAAGCSSDLQAHCRAVMGQAVRLTDALTAAGYLLDREQIQYAALLHDIAKAELSHPSKAAQWLKDLGYPQLYGPISQHHDHDGAMLDEAAIVYLADKSVQGAHTVTMDERFAHSRDKCRDEMAKTAHNRRYRAAILLKNKLNTICRSEVLI